MRASVVVAVLALAALCTAESTIYDFLKGFVVGDDDLDG